MASNGARLEQDPHRNTSSHTALSFARVSIPGSPQATRQTATPSRPRRRADIRCFDPGRRLRSKDTADRTVLTPVDPTWTMATPDAQADAELTFLVSGMDRACGCPAPTGGTTTPQGQQQAQHAGTLHVDHVDGDMDGHGVGLGAAGAEADHRTARPRLVSWAILLRLSDADLAQARAGDDGGGASPSSSVEVSFDEGDLSERRERDHAGSSTSGWDGPTAGAVNQLEVCLPPTFVCAGNGRAV